jgi:hypothetical protein
MPYRKKSNNFKENNNSVALMNMSQHFESEKDMQQII